MIEKRKKISKNKRKKKKKRKIGNYYPVIDMDKVPVFILIRS